MDVNTITPAKVEQLERELAEARERIAQLEEDAARLDFLGDPMRATHENWRHFMEGTATPQELRKAIDQAIEAVLSAPVEKEKP